MGTFQFPIIMETRTHKQEKFSGPHTSKMRKMLTLCVYVCMQIYTSGPHI